MGKLIVAAVSGNEVMDAKASVATCWLRVCREAARLVHARYGDIGARVARYSWRVMLVYTTRNVAVHRVIEHGTSAPRRLQHNAGVAGLHEPDPRIAAISACCIRHFAARMSSHELAMRHGAMP
jgi:hypothetical protein